MNDFEAKYKNLQLLLQGFSHEIKNPFSIIQGALDILEQKHNITDEQRSKVISDALMSMKAITKILCSINTISNGNNVVQKINLSDIIEEILNVCVLFQDIKKVSHIFFDKSSLRDIEANINKGDFYQILSNIILNSAEATLGKDDSTISIYRKSIEKSNDIVVIVKDNGVGISNENLSITFTQGFSTKQGGNGLGLLIVKNLCIKNNIDISLESEENIGTKVILRIKNE